MSPLEQALADYLQLRHSLGHELAEAGWLLKLGDAAEFAVAARKPLEAWLHAREARKAQRHFLMAQVDGQGAERVAAWMMEPA